MTWKRYVVVIAATAMIGLGVITMGTFTASAATPQCANRCISIFSHQLGTYAQPNVVEAVLDGAARVGQPVILKKADNSDPSEDLLGLGGSVSDFYAKGLISAAANNRYAGLQAAQIEYAPYGNDTGLCVGLAETPYENEGLTLQPCTVLEGRTVWIIDGPDSPTTAPAFFPIVNAATTDFSRPFAMSYPSDQAANPRRLQQIIIRRLQFLTDEHTLRDNQLWGAYPGVLP